MIRRYRNYRIMLCVALFLSGASLIAQPYDHRTRRVDSLEQILAANPPEAADLALLYRRLATDFLQIDREKSMDYARKCIDAAVPLDGWRAVAEGYKVLGLNFYKISQYDSAAVYYGKQLEAVERMRDFPKKYKEPDIEYILSSTYGNIGNLYNIQGKCPEALEYYQKALLLFEKYDWKESQTFAYKNIGQLHLALNNYEQAKLNFIKTDSLAYILNDTYIIAETKYHLSCLYLATGDYDKALQNIETAYDYYSAHPEEGENIAKARNHLSQIYLEGYGDDRRAEEYVRQALVLLDDELDIPREKSISLRLLSSIYLKRGDWRQAGQTALEALAADDSEPANTIALYGVLSKSYAHQGNAALSAEYFDKYDALKSVWSAKNYQSSIREMEVKYETEKKDAEIERQQNLIARHRMQRVLWIGGVALCVVIVALLWNMLRLRTRRNLALAERNDALSERTAALAEMNATKDKFFSIISHDLKNPAVAQREALQMLFDKASGWDAATLREYYGELLQSADHQVKLLYNLLGWAQLQTGRMTCRPARFDLARQLRSDIAVVGKMATGKGVALQTDMPGELPVTGDANMLSTVVRNLLTNGVKYTASGGVVTLEIIENGELRMENGAVNSTASGEGSAILNSQLSTLNSEKRYAVSISDTGIGMSREQISNLFRLGSLPAHPGTAGETGSGLGLIVCRELLEKHGTTLNVESTEGEGSRFWFEVKIEN